MNVTAALLVSAVIASRPPRPAARLDGAATRARIHPAALPVAVFAATLAVIMAERFSLVIAVSIAAVTLWRVLSARQRARWAGRRQAIVALFLGHVVTNVQAGSTLEAACSRAADHLPEDCPAPLANNVRQLVAAARTGTAPHDVFATAPAPELADVAALWSLAIHRGLPVADLLARARERIDTAERHRAATEAALAGPKTTAAVLSLLPLAGVAMGSAMGANPLGLLLGGGLGGWLLVGGTALISAGFLTCQHIIARAAA